MMTKNLKTLFLKKKKNNVEKGKFTGGEKYVLSSLDLRLKSEDITMWPDYEK